MPVQKAGNLPEQEIYYRNLLKEEKLSFTLELWLHLPGVRCKPPKEETIHVPYDQQARALVHYVGTELGEALPVEPGGKQKLPLVLHLCRQVGVDVDDGWDVKEADNSPSFDAFAVREQVEDVVGLVGEGVQDVEALPDDNTEEN